MIKTKTITTVFTSWHWLNLLAKADSDCVSESRPFIHLTCSPVAMNKEHILHNYYFELVCTNWTKNTYVLYCNKKYRTKPKGIVLHCTALHVVFWCDVLHPLVKAVISLSCHLISLYCIVWYITHLHHIALHFNAIYYIAWHFIATFCIALYFTALYCDTLQLIVSNF